MGDKKKSGKLSQSRLSDGGDAFSVKSLQMELRQMREEMREEMQLFHKLAKTDDIKEIVDRALENMKAEILIETRNMVEKKYKEVDEKIDGFLMETDLLKGQLKQKDDEIEKLRKAMKVTQCDTNYNQQYSRKCNIRVVGVQETADETADMLRDKFIHLCKEASSDARDKVNLNRRDIVAIHRLPSRAKPRPLIVKFFNNEAKSSVMRKKKVIKEKHGIRMQDDITKDNLDLIHRLNSHREIEYAWYYNCAIYGKSTSTEMKVRFDLYDDINQVLRQHVDNVKK
ncbi:uncharacterized protein PF3D7_1120000-like [Argopecten irradians]|uniref:uncharacterized protein PF3D7_1120000-like n=1 Tax=Argopecten irradians TaxID=31199 RepID=UPI0037135602